MFDIEVGYLTEQVDAYKAQIANNIDKLTQALDSGNYPHLNHFLCQRYKGAAFNRLCEFHNYHLNGKIGIFDYNSYRGVEAMASINTLVKTYKGNPWTWQNYLLKWEVLGLVRVKKPKDDDYAQKYNTSKQCYSVQRAKEKSAKSGHTIKPCSWYQIPVYDDALFAEAESRAADIKDITGKVVVIDKYKKDASRMIDEPAGIPKARLTAPP